MSRLPLLLPALLLWPLCAAAQVRPDQQPTYTPFTDGPELTNRGQVGALLAERYPAVLRQNRIEGTAVLWLFVDEDGNVTNQQINRSSGYEAMDEVALAVARAMRFTPARNRDRVVPVWINRAVAFRLDGEQPVASVDAPPDEEAERGSGPLRSDAQRAPARTRPLSEAPVFTPYTSRPELLNAEEVVAALVERYPPELEAAGIEGTVAVWLFIDEEGRVLRRVIDVSSGYDAMDRAALAVTATMRFRPARLNGAVTPVWISVPIRFRVN